MGALDIFFSQIYSVIRTFSISDVIDILLIAYITYKGIQLIRETRAGQLVKGILLLGIFYALAVLSIPPFWNGLKTTSFLLRNIFQIGIIALVVLFQPEIRRALEKFGRTKVTTKLGVFGTESHEKGAVIWENAIAKICEAAETLSKTRTGALMVIERNTRLGEQIDTGVFLNAEISVELLLNIFFVNTPLHDGAVIVRDGRVLAAACFLPKPQKEEFIATNFGSRHRAAIGISEVSDAITIVVSEETGTISITEDGQMFRNFTRSSLSGYLTDKLIPSKDTEESPIKKVFRRAKKK